jgi:hypothetical protein
MTTTAPEPAQAADPRPVGDARPRTARRLRVTAPPSSRPGEPPRAPRRPGPVRRLRVGVDTTPAPGRPSTEVEPAPTPQHAPADPTALCCSVVRASVEVLRGERPATQVARWVTPVVLDQLLERARLVLAARPTGPSVRAGRPVTVRRVRLVRLSPTTAEATVVLDDDGRVRAAAVRLEAHRGTWRVAVLEIG